MPNQRGKRIARAGLILAAAFVVIGVLIGGTGSMQRAAAAADLTANQAPMVVIPTPTPHATVDHHTFPALNGPFEKPQDVTKACLACHPDAAKEIQHTTHWTWEFVNQTTGEVMGKKHLINNFCISIQSNEPRCTSCHVGYGWKDKNFNFNVQENIDCLVCHDTTGTYKKFPTGAGLPASKPKEFPPKSGKIWQPPDLTDIAQNVGLSSRQTCGACHFYGGGGDEVKHGDLDSSLIKPSHDLDVHMDAAGLNFSCTTCHETVKHDIPGSRYSMDSQQWKGCESCHTDKPHNFSILNEHTDRIACETCHIPEYARGGKATKMWWDWSKAGKRNEDGKPYSRKDEAGHVVFDTKKGEFVWKENVVPEYVWFNGSVTYKKLGEEIDPKKVVSINHFNGSIEDPNSRIWPVKHFRGKQPYDSVNNTLVVPHLFGKDSAAFWGNFDWQKAIAFGMNYVGLPYSGEYDFVETEMYWPITHMVAPAEQALTCNDCHVAKDGRLDFAALGYSEEEVKRLTHFPPTLTKEMMDAPHNSPDYCAGCHSKNLSEEQIQRMTDEYVAQLKEQQAEGENQPTMEEIKQIASELTARLVARGGQYELWAHSKHGQSGVGCVSCHTLEEGKEHPMHPYSIEKSAEVCGACHLEEYRDWKESKHADITNKNPVTCVACHEPHGQEMRIINDNTSACMNCHHDEPEEMVHSTHAAAGLNCTDCHKNTDKNTGHTFVVESDTCIKCHGDTAHNANHILALGGEPQKIDKISAHEIKPIEVQTQEKPIEGAGVVLPVWVMVLLGVVIGAAGFWFFVGKEPGSEHPENQRQDDKA